MLDILPTSGPRHEFAVFATSLAYTSAEIAAAFEYLDRKERRTDPPGEFDHRGRFFAAERTLAVTFCRAPSARWPFPQMLAARTADHCAELFDVVEAKHVKRLALAFARFRGGETFEDLRRLLTPGIRARQAAH
ncbi:MULTISPECIES: hypothetical protein [unclassified Thioclava]|uniref:hypothetical protein n=1 Tax=unclassified Thioclava TaxID=2621713 RepID=UPI000998A7F1|nr:MULTISPECIES: hypothetical protein [unclassified Thioclava]OOY06995.1 hypothetical protein BMI89_19995 [Thioclava sp. F36-7]OOY15003.1 hypothetical protein BMI85_15735 [Thioclava sp. DLFJ4-1]